jgi:hypothetical protein
MAAMSTPAEPPPEAPDPGDRRPPDRRLSRPPGERYATDAAAADSATAVAGREASPARGVLLGLAAGLASVAATVVLGGLLSISAGLLVVAAAGGWAVGVAVRTGSAGTVRPATRGWLAAAIAVGSVVLGQIGLWLYARDEGGVLSLPDYLGQTFGILVPIQLVIAVVVAWWSAR